MQIQLIELNDISYKNNDLQELHELYSDIHNRIEIMYTVAPGILDKTNDPVEVLQLKNEVLRLAQELQRIRLSIEFLGGV